MASSSMNSTRVMPCMMMRQRMSRLERAGSGVPPRHPDHTGEQNAQCRQHREADQDRHERDHRRQSKVGLAAVAIPAIIARENAAVDSERSGVIRLPPMPRMILLLLALLAACAGGVRPVARATPEPSSRPAAPVRAGGAAAADGGAGAAGDRRAARRRQAGAVRCRCWRAWPRRCPPPRRRRTSLLPPRLQAIRPRHPRPFLQPASPAVPRQRSSCLCPPRARQPGRGNPGGRVRAPVAAYRWNLETPRARSPIFR